MRLGFLPFRFFRQRKVIKMSEEFMNVIRSRCSTRAFTQGMVSEEELEQIIEAGRTAPIAGADYRMSHMTVLRDPEILAKIREGCMLKRKDGTAVDPMYGAQTIIFLSATGPSEDCIEYCNVACAIENMALTATSLGLGSVYLWGFLKKLRKQPDLIDLLQIPEGYTILSALAVGYSKDPIQPHEPKGRIAVNYV